MGVERIVGVEVVLGKIDVNDGLGLGVLVKGGRVAVGTKDDATLNIGVPVWFPETLQLIKAKLTNTNLIN